MYNFKLNFETGYLTEPGKFSDNSVYLYASVHMKSIFVILFFYSKDEIYVD